jgi:hypothetical protein
MERRDRSFGSMRHHYKKTSSARIILLLPVVIALLAGSFTGCSDDYLAIVAVSPANVGVVPGGQIQFGAAVVGLEDKSVKWAVNGKEGGDEVYGTISEDGLYTAPTEIPVEPTVEITAACAGDQSVHGSASATIVGTITVEMEDFITSYDEEGGTTIRTLTCSGASGNLVVEGFDKAGDQLGFNVFFEVPGWYAASLRQAAVHGAHNEIKVMVQGAGPDGSDQEAAFDVVGQGIT